MLAKTGINVYRNGKDNLEVHLSALIGYLYETAAIVLVVFYT